MMMTDDSEIRRRSAKAALERTWELCDEVERYATGFPTGDAMPDFSGRASLMVPDRKQEAADRFGESSLAQIAEMVRSCTACGLSSGRTCGVPGEGVVNARVMVVGEGPGAEEDRTGRPFVGRAGRYLDSWLSSIGLSRERNVFIANVVKCRPPGNRDPFPEEVHACMPYLERQIALVKPEVILCVGRIAAHFLLDRSEGLGKLRGTFHRFGETPVLVTYHPAAVLRNNTLRAPVWEDLKRLALFLDLPIAQKKR